MERVKFNKCLNLESKAWNLPVIALYGAGFGSLLGMMLYGGLGLTVGITAGFFVGRYLSYSFHLGNLQRYLYTVLPKKKSKKVPSSCTIHLN